MTYELAIGDRAYSSWSLRGWLLFDAFGLPVRCRTARLYTDGFARLLADFAPARSVPALRSDGVTLAWDSLAIAELLAEAHPEAGIWPGDPMLRATARSLAAEMHAGFAALRSACPMNLRVAYAGFAADPAVSADLARLEAIWAHALAGSGGPWLCGAYSAADVFFAPVAARIATYGLKVGARAAAYVDAHLAHPSFRRWRAMALVDGADQEVYARPLAHRPWPGPVPLPAHPVASGRPVNDSCPYSGEPVTDFLQLGFKVYGFCNPFCRDKTVADPAAWPAFAALAGLSSGAASGR